MPALSYPVFFRKSFGLFQGSRNSRAMTISFSSQPSLKYLGLSIRMLKEQHSLQKGLYVCVKMLDQVPAKGYGNTVKWRQAAWFFGSAKSCTVSLGTVVTQSSCPCPFDSLCFLTESGFGGLDLRGMKRTLWAEAGKALSNNCLNHNNNINRKWLMMFSSKQHTDKTSLSNT